MNQALMDLYKNRVFYAEIKNSRTRYACGERSDTWRRVNSGLQGPAMKVAQLCPTLYNPMDCIVHGQILQARILEWVGVAFSFSRLSSQPRDRTQVPPCTEGQLFLTS